MKFIWPAVAEPPYSTWDKVILLGASTTYALKQKSSSKYNLEVHANDAIHGYMYVDSYYFVKAGAHRHFAICTRPTICDTPYYLYSLAPASRKSSPSIK